MLRGLYTAASAMMAQMTRQGIISNNINNVSTTGYKQEIATQGLFAEMLMNRVQRADLPIGAMTASAEAIGPMTLTAGAVRATTDHGQGALTDTGNELDLALTGPGFFVVETPTGLHYTRDGSFLRDAAGQVVAADGARVLGVDGPLTLPPGVVLVESDGTIAVDGRPVGQLRLVELPPDQLTRAGLNRYTASGVGEPAAATAVNQGFLEGANVDMARAVADMMAAARSYEAGQRLMQMQDDLLGKAVNEIGRVG